jgi:hypothetical protein
MGDSVVGAKYVNMKSYAYSVTRECELKLEISNGKLKIDLENLEKALGIKGGFEIPLQNIVKAGTEALRTGWTETRAPGAHVPGAVKAGTYNTPRGREFWYVTDKGVLVLELEDEPYQRIILSVDGNQKWADRINKATSK